MADRDIIFRTAFMHINKDGKKQKKKSSIVRLCHRALRALTSCLNRWLWEAMVTHSEEKKKKTSRPTVAV